MRTEEKTLILPTLYIINEYGSVTTTEIKEKLIALFNPNGEDAEILAGRKDTKFTQIVRNLMGSHYQTNGMEMVTKKSSEGRNGRFSLTEAGKKHLEENIKAVWYIFDNRFKFNDVGEVFNAIASTKGKRNKVIVYDEKEMISEGKVTKKETVTKKRCSKLREAAIKQYTKESGRIVCEVCEFDFEQKYGLIGKGFIEIHHEEPIYQYSDDGFERYIGEAVEKMKPLCANCHRIIHRSFGTQLTIAELKTITKN